MSSSSDSSANKTKLIERLYEIGVVKFGSFLLKNGITSPVYVDFRVMTSRPDLMVELSQGLWKCLPSDVSVDVVCGVPYGALPVAALMTLHRMLPLVMRRKEVKSYGTKKRIEGSPCPGHNCLIVEDVTTSGSSILETAQDLIAESLKVSDAVVILDRNQGAVQNLSKHGIRLHFLTSLNEVITTLESRGKIDRKMATSVREFLERNASVALDQPASSVNVSRNTRLSLSFPQRLSSVRHPLARRLMEAMFRKRSLLCLSADTRSANELLQVAREAAPHIILLKTHSDAVQGFSRSTGMELKRLAKEHDFLLMEDRKYSDIGSTVQSQYKASPICVNTWADLVTVHALPGPGVLEALRQVPCTGDRGVVLIAEMSSEGTLADKEYAERVVSMSEQFRDFVCGFVAQSPVHRDPGMLQMTPGVKLATSDEATSGDGLGQKYHSVRDAVVNRGADIIIVGRGILKSDDRSDAAESYQRASFDAYMERISRQSFSICV